MLNKGGNRSDLVNSDKKINFTVVIYLTVFMLISVAAVFILQFVINVKYKEASVSGSDMTYEKHYAFITDNSTDTFWRDAYDAAKEAGRILGIYVEKTGSQLSGDYTTAELMDMAIASKVDGIIVNPVDDETKEKIEEASEKGIDVVTIFNDMIGGSRICFVGAGNYKMGQEYGLQISNTLKDMDGKVLVLIDSNDSNNQNLIYSSMKEYLKDKELEVSNMIIDTHNAFAAEEAIRNIVLGTPRSRPDLLVCLSALNTECAYQAVVDFNKVGALKIVGYYGGPGVIMEAISKQIIDSVIMVDAQQMGGRSVEALYEYQSTGRVNEYCLVSTKIIDGSSADLYREDGEE